jgi:hypothetical protein
VGESALLLGNAVNLPGQGHAAAFSSPKLVLQAKCQRAKAVERL